jgi:hypothetical protein
MFTFASSSSESRYIFIFTRSITYLLQVQSMTNIICPHKLRSFLNPYSIDDHALARLISDTPARCILLLEDLDCAFPHSREDDSDDENERDPYEMLMPLIPAKSNVTLSGLLNVLDSISSEEGRVTFATVFLILLTTYRLQP